MLKHYLKVAFRQIKRSFLFSSINMMGFVIGMMAAFLIYLWIVDELTFEDFHKDRDSIYRLVLVEQKPTGELIKSATSVEPLILLLRERFPQVEQATYINYESKVPLRFEDNLITSKVSYVDTAFFDLFHFPVVAGDPNALKHDPSSIVLSEPMAKKLFGNVSPIGKVLVEEMYGATSYLKVAAVLKIPRKSHIQFDLVKSRNAYRFTIDWRCSEHTQSYVRLKKNAAISKADRKALNQILTNRIGKSMKLTFQALDDIHLSTDFKDPYITNYGNMSQIYLFLALSALIIFMGAFNFTTISTAQASLRFKEIGVRKITGVKRKGLILQFLSESMVLAFLALLFALSLTELLLPLYNQLMEKDIALKLNWEVLLFIFFGVFGVGCLAGSFPALYMSAFNPLLAIKGGKLTGKKGTLIKGLVCVQFVIAITMILCTSVVFKQLHFIQNADLGLDKENIVSVESSLWYDVDEFKQEVLKNPNVKEVAMGAPISNYLQGKSSEEKNVHWVRENGELASMQMVTIFADSDFANTFGLKLLQGDAIQTDFSAYFNGKYDFPVLINETAWKMMKVENPIGIVLQNGFDNFPVKIVGVVKDFNFQSLRDEVKPAYLVYSPEFLTWLHIKIAAENKVETLKFLKQKYEEMSPGTIFTYQYFTDALNQNYAREQQQSRMLLIFTVLAIVIAMLGVYGLVTLSVRQRTKEIGIRKVNGAHSDRIVRMFCYEYIRSVGIAFLIACPLGYLLMTRWLSEFAYQTAIRWWLFLLAGLVIALITILTVIAQTWRAASRNPVTSLRYE